MLGAASDSALAHPWHRHRRHDQHAVQQQAPPPVAPRFLLTANAKPKRVEATDIAKAFEPFVDLKAISCRSDDRYFFVESNGIPDHPLMVGIRAWQQQVPLPQKYNGDNAWQIPLQPVPAANPVTTKDRFLRGAIALAVNGVPIFNPLNNRGEDAFLIGELDDYGGHCGRADDYHYHIAPVHLEKQVGKGMPIAYALDGYPIYGYTAPTPTSRRLTYEVSGRQGFVDYKVNGDGTLVFDYTDPSGKKTTETYTPRGRGQGGRGGPGPRGEDGRGPRRPGDDRPPPPPQSGTKRPAGRERSGTSSAKASKTEALTVTSSAIGADGNLPVEFTCDGAGASPPLEWQAGPPGTKSYAVTLWHEAPDQVKSFWVVYGIPGNITQLAKNARNVGTTGLNDKNRAEYDPMCSKGPGVKTYHVTVYALSALPQLRVNAATRVALLDAIKDITLAEGTLTYTYERGAR